MANAHGQLEHDTVLVCDESQANRLQAKGAYGTRTGNGLELDLHEAAYLIEANRLTVHHDDETVPAADLIAQGAAQHEGFETNHLVYRDYRSRGYVITQGDDELDAYTRGAQPPNQNPSTLIAARSEADPATPSKLISLITRSHGLGRNLLLAVVDEESDVTYYQTDLAHTTGNVPDPAPNHAQNATARVLQDRAILTEPNDELTQAGYGHTVGNDTYLSLAETHHLAHHGLTLTDTNHQPLTPDDVQQRAKATHPDAAQALAAYTWARERDLIPKTGFKFGVHYRIYQDPPDQAHAPYLLHATPLETDWTYRELARFVRLAHSVKKQPILWTPDAALMTQWTRP